MKQIIYFLQYIGFIFIYFLYKILPLNLSLKVSSFLFRTFGKFSRANKTAINNCKYVFPNLKDEEIQNIIKKSWNNLGITICELLRINDIFYLSHFSLQALHRILIIFLIKLLLEYYPAYHLAQSFRYCIYLFWYHEYE